MNVLFISPRNLLLCREIAWECFHAIKGVIQNIQKKIEFLLVFFKQKNMNQKYIWAIKGPFYISFLLVIYNQIIMN